MQQITSSQNPVSGIIVAMDTTRLIFIRHGETEWNAVTRIQGHTDIGLNAHGHAQAACVARALAHEDLDAIVCSDLSRARQTAEATQRLNGAKLTVDANWRERCFGAFEGHTFDEIAAMHPEQSLRWRQRDPDWQPPRGESLTMLWGRIERTLHALAARHVGQHVAVFTHGGVLDIVHRLATRQSLQAPRTWQLANAAINRLLWTPDTLHVVGWDDQQHLQDAQLQAAIDERTT